jgi:adenosylmethionine-8-amino-7-oxononanoate aminotransferase
VQGTAGMVMYNPEFLDEMISICKAENISTIADEVMTGFGRTGKFFASDYLKEQPDIVCLSKGITGGVMALGVTSCSDKIYDAFLSEDKTKTLFHGHSYTANPVACSASLASLDLLEQEETWENIERISHLHQQFQKIISDKPGVKNCRVRGTILAVEFETGSDSSYLSSIRDKLYDFFIERKIILRPLGNVVYVMPAYCISNQDLEIIYTSITVAIDKFAVNPAIVQS